MSKKDKKKRKKHQSKGAMSKWMEKASGDFSEIYTLPEGTKKC